MDQELIFKQVYLQLKQKIESLTQALLKDKLKKGVSVSLQINDVRQCDININGKQIVIGETFYDPPAYYHLTFTVIVSGKTYDDVLEAYGYTARYLKDDRAVSLKDCNWHNNMIEDAYFSPIVGESDSNRVNNEGEVSFKLSYEIRLGLNSRNSKGLVRVKEPATVTGKVMK